MIIKFFIIVIDNYSEITLIHCKYLPLVEKDAIKVGVLTYIDMVNHVSTKL